MGGVGNICELRSPLFRWSSAPSELQAMRIGSLSEYSRPFKSFVFCGTWRHRSGGL
jgi:hypothetical protein